MASFSAAVQKVLALEGGYQDYPNDTGNYNSLGQLVGTNFGISAPVYERWIGRPPSRADMQSMSRTEAEAIYKTRFWQPIQGDRIQPQYLANILFDGAVNHGVSRGVKLLQQVLGVQVDGVVGPETLGAIARGNPAQIHDAYKRRRIEFYRQLAAGSPAYASFLNGWLNRMDKYPDKAGGTSGGLAIALAAAAFFFLS